MLRPNLDACGIAEGCFTPAEAGWVRSLPSAGRHLSFTAMWTVKEAVPKAGGQGIVRGMHGLAVGVAVPGTAGAQVRRGLLGGWQAVACLARTP